VLAADAGCPSRGDETGKRCGGCEETGNYRLFARLVRCLTHALLCGIFHAFCARKRLLYAPLRICFRQPSLTRDDLRKVRAVACIQRSLGQSDSKNTAGLGHQCRIRSALSRSWRRSASRRRLRTE